MSAPGEPSNPQVHPGWFRRANRQDPASGRRGEGPFVGGGEAIGRLANLENDAVDHRPSTLDAVRRHVSCVRPG